MLSKIIGLITISLLLISCGVVIYARKPIKREPVDVRTESIRIVKFIEPRKTELKIIDKDARKDRVWFKLSAKRKAVLKLRRYGRIAKYYHSLDLPIFRKLLWTAKVVERDTLTVKKDSLIYIPKDDTIFYKLGKYKDKSPVEYEGRFTITLPIKDILDYKNDILEITLYHRNSRIGILSFNKRKFLKRLADSFSIYWDYKAQIYELLGLYKKSAEYYENLAEFRKALEMYKLAKNTKKVKEMEEIFKYCSEFESIYLDYAYDLRKFMRILKNPHAYKGKCFLIKKGDPKVPFIYIKAFQITGKRTGLFRIKIGSFFSEEERDLIEYFEYDPFNLFYLEFTKPFEGTEIEEAIIRCEGTYTYLTKLFTTNTVAKFRVIRWK